jgi:hypothetical protein
MTVMKKANERKDQLMAYMKQLMKSNEEEKYENKIMDNRQ